MARRTRRSPVRPPRPESSLGLPSALSDLALHGAGGQRAWSAAVDGVGAVTEAVVRLAVERDRSLATDVEIYTGPAHDHPVVATRRPEAESGAAELVPDQAPLPGD